MERNTWKWKNMGEFVTALSFYYVLVGGVAEHDAKTYGKLSLLICITLYQHLGSKGAKFFNLRSIFTDHVNQAKREFVNR